MYDRTKGSFGTDLGQREMKWDKRRCSGMQDQTQRDTGREMSRTSHKGVLVTVTIR
jgi:hypothetical protein